MATIIDKCPKCGQDISEQEWGKNPKNYGKPYHAWRHVEKNPDCDFIEWCDKLPPKKPYASKTPQNTPKIVPKGEDYQNLLNADRKLYALILAVAHIQGVKQEDIENELTRMEYEKK